MTLYIKGTRRSGRLVAIRCKVNLKLMDKILYIKL
jgi:hypothetical protein